MQQRPRSALFARRRVGGFDLAEDLGFTDHQRVETRGDPEEMTNDVRTGVGIQVRRQLGVRHVVEPAHEHRQVPNRRHRIFARHVELGPIARGQYDCLGESWAD